MKEEVTVGEVRMAGERAVMPIVRSVICSWEGGGYLAVEPVAVVVADRDGALLLTPQDEEVPEDLVREAVERAYAASRTGTG